MNKRPRILVVGSISMDLIVTAERFPNAGETVIGNGFSTAPGGKGANQAIAAARRGAEVTLVGKVGNDDFGKALIASAKQSGVNTEYVYISDLAPTGVAAIQIQSNESGTENKITVVPGANFKLTVDDVEFLKDSAVCYDMVILQHEIPDEVNKAVAAYAKESGVPVMLNPAPAREVSQSLMQCLSYISPNEHEALSLTGIAPESGKTDKSIESLRKMGADNVLITLGKLGCAFSSGGKTILSPSIDCGKVVDPTAAGDSFIGAFCTAVSAGIPTEDSLIFANCVGGITVSRLGAQTSLPYIDEVLKIMNEKGIDTAPFEALKR
jgi:ribokinase